MIVNGDFNDKLLQLNLMIVILSEAMTKSISERHSLINQPILAMVPISSLRNAISGDTEESGSPPEAAIDGDVLPDVTNAACSVSTGVTQAWWRVDMSHTITVTAVIISGVPSE